MILRFTSFVLLFAASFQVHAVNLTLTMNDSYGDGWNGAYWNVYNESGGYVTSGTLATGFSGSVIINLSEGCYSIEVTEGSYPEEISWSLSGMTMPTNVSGGAGDSLPFSVGSATCSFNGLFQMSMTDSGNNGWQGGSWYVQDPFGVVVASGTLLTGSSGNDYFELSDGCYTVGITGGTSSSQMGWTLTNLGTNVVVATGNASTADFSIYVGLTPCNPNFVLAEGQYSIEIWNPNNLTGSMSITNTKGVKVLDVAVPQGAYNFQLVTLPTGCYTFQINGSGSTCTYTFEGWDGLLKSGSLSSNKFFAFQNVGITKGCTDPSACNFVATAQTDDGSCCNEECTRVQITGASSTFTWSLFRSGVLVLKGTGNFDGTSCFNYSSLYFMSMSDTQGQGGGSATYTLSRAADNFVFSSGKMHSGSSDLRRAGIGGRFGCMDTRATNADPDATINSDFTCMHNPISFDIQLTGSGNNGSVYIYDMEENYMDQVYMPNGYKAHGDLCLPAGCYKFQFFWPASVSNVTVKQGNTILLSADYVQNQQWYTFCVEDLDEGCTQPEACNYDENVSLDNGMCCTSNCTLFQFDYNLYNISSELYWELLDENGERVANAEADGEVQLCLNNGCYTLHRFNSVSSNSNFVVTDVATGDTLTSGFMNYQDIPFTFCVVNHPGCTDPEACNYDPEALSDDGTCCYGTCATFVMGDINNNGWNGATVYIRSANDLLFEGTLEGGYQEIPLCLADGCYTIESTGTWDGEGYYSLNSEEGEIVAGAPGFTYYFDMGTIVSGCTDSHALNYDPSANCHACSCIYPCEGDFNYDNQVALPDLLLFLSAFDCDWNCCRFDLSGDGVINTGDFLLLSSAFGGVCD